MSWTRDIWSQNDSYNEGLPYITNSGYPVEPDTSGIKFSWSITLGKYEDMPYNEFGGYSDVPDASNIKFAWLSDPTNNFGLPYMTYMENVGAFVNCTLLTSVVIPPSVKYIDYYSFWNTGLTEVTIASDCVYYPTSFPSGCTINFYS